MLVPDIQQPLLALTRAVPHSIVDCELTHLERTPIDLARASEQHDRYERALALLGLSVQRLPSEHELPDSVFVEDTAVVLDELAVIARPGATSRRAETATMESALAPYRLLVHIQAPGTLDGGDVLVIGRRIFVGQSGRTNRDAIWQGAPTAMRSGRCGSCCRHSATAFTVSRSPAACISRVQ
jgi:dimethylargininase